MVKQLQPDSNQQSLTYQTNTQRFNPTDQMIGLCFLYLPARCILVYVLIMSRMSFRVNPHSIDA